MNTRSAHAAGAFHKKETVAALGRSGLGTMGASISVHRVALRRLPGAFGLDVTVEVA
jgi:hypothetical protein